MKVMEPVAIISNTMIVTIISTTSKDSMPTGTGRRSSHNCCSEYTVYIHVLVCVREREKEREAEMCVLYDRKLFLYVACTLHDECVIH